MKVIVLPSGYLGGLKITLSVSDCAKTVVKISVKATHNKRNIDIPFFIPDLLFVFFQGNLRLDLSVVHYGYL